MGAVLIFWRGGYTMMAGADLWWHIASGRLIFENRWVPSNDPWAFTSTKPWVVDAWLSDLILYLWSRWFGIQSLVYWKWLVIVVTFVILMRLLKRLSGSELAAYLASVAALTVASAFLDLRPQIHSLLFFVILLELCLERERLSWLLVPLFLLWANFHAGFALGLLTLPILSLPYLVKRDQRAHTLWLLAACALVCLVNPNGVQSFSQPFIYALQSDSVFTSIEEWSSPFKPGGIGSSYYPYLIGLFTGSIVLQMLRGSMTRPSVIVSILLGVMTLAMSVKSRRFVSIFAISESLIVAMAFGPVLRGMTAKIHSFFLPLVAVALGILLLWPFPQRAYAFHYLTLESWFPVETVNFIEVNELSGKVFSYYNWGGYLHYRTDGRMSVYIDGRASAVFDEEVYRKYLRVLNRAPNWPKIVERSRAAYFLWPTKEPAQTKRLLRSGNWRVLYGDAVSTLLVRTSYDLPSDLITTPDSAAKYYARGEAARKKGKLAEAAKFFERALEWKEYHAGACRKLARTEARMGNVERSREVFVRCQKTFPRFTEHRSASSD